MGFFKKIFKPVSKVLDKIIPNEIKPALPYLAAFAPVFGPTAGMFGSTMGKRMLLSGGANILGQLSQEGSEGDINLLSAGLGALTGAMTTPGAAETFQGMKTPTGSYKGVVDGVADTVIKRPELSFLDQAKNFGLEGLSKGSNILRPEGGIPDLFSKAGAKAALLPASTATGDVMEASARQLEKQQIIDDALAAAEALADSGSRAAAIRNAMLSYGFFSDEEIEDTIASAGYRAGGRVGFRFGGIDEAIESVQEETIEKGKDGIMTAAKEDPLLVEEYNKYVFDLMEQRPDAKPMSFQDFKRMIKSGMKSGGRVGFKDGASTGSFGLDRYASEMLSEGKMLDKDATNFLDKYEDIVKEGKADERVFDLLKEYRTLEDKADKSLDKFSNTKLEDAAEGIMSVEDMKYYDKKIDDIDEKLDDSDKRLNTLDKEFVTKGIDASEITRTPDFQEWLELYMSERGTGKSTALDHPNVDIYMAILGTKLKGRDESFYKAVPRAKDGGLMNLGGKEMDLRGGGFVPIGKKERADDVPARLSKNEFVMTADAVRAAGGGSVNEGAKRMYDVMNKLEARA